MFKHCLLFLPDLAASSGVDTTQYIWDITAPIQRVINSILKL